MDHRQDRFPNSRSQHVQGVNSTKSQTAQFDSRVLWLGCLLVLSWIESFGEYLLDSTALAMKPWCNLLGAQTPACKHLRPYGRLSRRQRDGCKTIEFNTPHGGAAAGELITRRAKISNLSQVSIGNLQFSVPSINGRAGESEFRARRRRSGGGVRGGARS